MWTQIKTVIGSLMQRIGSLIGSAENSRVWVASYWPMLAGILVALPFVFMPAIFGLSAWTYLVTVPIGIGAGVIGYSAAYMYMDA